MDNNFKIQMDLDVFFNKLHFRLEEYKKVRSKFNIYLSKDFNVFDYINPYENKLSDIFADLLNTNGKHGQGNKFLGLFFNHVGLEGVYNLNTSDIRIERESFTSHIDNSKRRIDITIDFEGQYGVGIENKPWAEDRDEQVSDYMKHMKKKYRDNYRIIYLSGDGTPPNENSIDISNQEYKEKVLVISYETEIIKWLDSCYKECQSEKFRWFLKDFINYVQQQFKI